ncbi:MAG: MarR family transcriptional regulator [Gordonibacter sp.]|nr:MarR family transcriptional regulator [Gordonibacter sp.]
MQDTVNQLSRTLALANRFLIARLEQQGLVGIAPSHGDILVQLFAHDELPMSDLAQRIDRDPSTVTALIKKLAAAGYVTTSKLNDDKRITLVSLTPKGQQLQPAFESISNDLCEIQVRGIEENDLTTLNNVLRTMQDNFKTALEGERA